MQTYPNLYGDFSAGSGHNALTRDPAVGIDFLKQFNSKIFFGTEIVYLRQTPVSRWFLQIVNILFPKSSW